jgi:peroxiredoxin
MKKIIWLAIAGLVLLTACQQRHAGFTLTGKITGLDSGEIYLSHRSIDSLITDTIQLKNGEFSFAGNTSEPVMYSLNIASDPQELDFFVDNSAIQIAASVDSLDKATVTGSPAEDQFLAYQKVLKPYNDQYEDLYKVYENAVKDSTIKQKEDSLNNIAEHIDSMENKVLIQFIKDHPASAIGAWAVTQSSLIYNPDPVSLESIYNSLDTSVQHTSYGKNIDTAMLIAKRLAVGQVAPDFTEMDTSGHPFTLSSLRGKYVLLDFWASWCGPCRRENPNVVKAFNKYKDKGFTVLGVSLDQDKASWIKAIHDDKLDWNQVSDLQYWHSKEAKLYGIKAIPSNFLLDKDGKIIARNLRGDELDKKLAEIFK